MTTTTSSTSIALLMLLLLCAVAAFPVGAADGTGFDIKGVPLGATEADVVARFPSIQCRDDPTAFSERTCTVLKETYGGAESSLHFSLIGGKVFNMRARFDSKDFAGVVGALKERFGPTTSDTSEPVTNRAGAKFENRTLTWNRGDALAIARRYAGSIDGSVMFCPRQLSGSSNVDHLNSRRKGPRTFHGGHP